MLRACVEEYRRLDWEAVRGFLNADQLKGSEPIFTRFIQFLKARIDSLDDIFSQNLGIKQQEMVLARIFHQAAYSF